MFAVTSKGSRGASRLSSAIQSHVDGTTCIRPWALATDTATSLNADSWRITAQMSAGSTPSSSAAASTVSGHAGG